jgi:hypothetical protein
VVYVGTLKAPATGVARSDGKNLPVFNPNDMQSCGQIDHG